MKECVPPEFFMNQNYPNPFFNITTIKYCLTYRNQVKLIIFNSDGFNHVNIHKKKELLMKTITLQIIILLCLFPCSSDLQAQVNPDLGINWVRNGNPVISTTTGSWNSSVFEANVIQNPDNDDSSKFQMWFAATPGNPLFPQRIGYAYSENGVSWKVYPDPVLTPTPDTWDSVTVTMPVVLYYPENKSYRMWYSSGDTDYLNFKAGTATSTDGINWVKNSLNPVFEAGEDPWEAGGVFLSSIIKEEGVYKMWYSGLTTAAIWGKTCIGYATSTDGIAWQRMDGNPILEPGPELWDSSWLILPKVLHLNNAYYMWYGGEYMNQFVFSVGLATSEDGVKGWKKHELNPVFRPQTGNQWDNHSVEAGTILPLNDSLLYMWYHGRKYETNWRIGLATTIIPTSVKEDYSEVIPSGYSLSQNYPNPFNPATVIKYELPERSIVLIKIYDILGNEIETLVYEEKAAGTYELTWNAENLPSGVYICRMKTENYTDVKKMTLLR
jgi:predicted GH43/DUF377 family glycosyl hydrolase